MYEAFYGFKEKPFSMLPDPGFLYLSKKHQAALTLLEYGLLNHVGFCVISGEAGAGKTTILRALLERVEDNVTVGLITNTHQSFGGLLDWVLSAFDLHQPDLTQVEMHQIFMEYLIEEYANGHTVLLIVDEAQNMKADALEELRMLSNVNSEKDQLVQVVLAGQPALKETLRKPELMQFAQRIAVDYHLDALNVVETCGYIQHRLMTAGAEKDVFTPAACERIHSYSGGTPRLINLLCETVLVYGFADQNEKIDVDLVDEMVQERMRDSVVPIVNRDAAKQDNKEATKALLKDFPWIESREKKPEQVEKSVKQEPVKAKPEKVKDDVETKPAPEVVKPAPVASSSDRGRQKSKVATKPASPSDSKSEVKPAPKANPVKAAASKKTTHNPVPPPAAPEGDGTKKQLIKLGSIAVVIAILLIGIAVYLSSAENLHEVIVDDEVERAAEEQTSNKVILELQKKREEEEARLRQLKLEAEALEKERAAAATKAEEEKRAEVKAAAAAAALAARQAEEKRLAAEKKRLADARERKRKAKADADRLKRERAKLEEDRRIMKARLEEENRIKQEENARRLEQEWQEKQRQQQLEEERAIAKARAERQAELEARARAEAESIAPECNGPAAKFKANCR